MPSHGYKCPGLSEQDPILKIIDKYRDHQCQQSVTVPAQKMSKLSKENYCRTINILRNISEIYERFLYDQIATYLF